MNDEGGYLIPEWIDSWQDAPGVRAAAWRWLAKIATEVCYGASRLAQRARRRGQIVTRVNLMEELLAATDRAHKKAAV